MLLPAFVWLAYGPWVESRQIAWQVELRWLLRAAYVGGAVLGWRAGRPAWFYPWLGFAVYEAVAALLTAATWLTSWAMQQGYEAAAICLGLALFPLSFAPYFAACVRGGWRRSQRLLAAYAVFPHAALTLPLFLVATGAGALRFAWAGTLMSAAVSAAAAVVFWDPSILALRRRPVAWGGRERGAALYGGVLLAQLLMSVGFGGLGGQEGLNHFFIVAAAVPLVLLGWLILSGPFLLPPLAQSLKGLTGAERAFGPLLQSGRRILALPSLVANRVAADLRQSLRSGYSSRKGERTVSEETGAAEVPQTGRSGRPELDRVYRLSIVALAALALALVALYAGRAAVYKIHEFERGLHLRGGRFLGVQMPGWHAQIPLVDTVIVVRVNERLGYVERIPAMTSDNVTMDVSLQYTYRVTNPERFALAVDDPERIVFEFVQGRLRDVINTKAMTGVMNQRAEMNLEIMQVLKEKEAQYGVEFMTVQIQSASPPQEVLSAIKDRMVAAQRQEQAEAEAAQKRTAADAQLYAAQKDADAQAYRISTTAAAEAERIRLTTEAQQLAVRAILGELEGKGNLAQKYIDYLIAVELKENSKWILGAGADPILELRTPAEE